MAEALLEQVQRKAKNWIDSPAIDADTKALVKSLLDRHDAKELIDSFYKDLEFGTGGLRGVMGAGSNCMNRYTVGIATQGLANYLLKTYPAQPIKVAIAHDSRNNSRLFTEVTANVFSANGIQVYLFPELRPTPLLSFAIRYLDCHSGVVITASHNPKEYNGYKAYWRGGAQVVPPHDKNIINEVNKITSFEQVKFKADPSLIHTIGPEVEAAYYEEVKKLIPKKDVIAKHHNIPLAYSSLHGAGITMVPACLKQIGFTNLHVVEEQKVPDGNFPTVASPNPEEQSAMELVIRKGKAVGATMVMATDPDTDRVGIGVRKTDGEFILLSGNQAFSLMMYFIMKNLNSTENTYIAKTIVTTELVDTMARQLGVECYNTLTGFKYIAELMGNLEGKKHFVAAGEESYGYMVGDFVRDKDAVSACAFFAAMAANAADENKSMYDWLIDMYVAFGFYKEGLVNLVRKGQQGEQEIRAMMEKYRSNPPATLNGSRIVRLLDYKTLKAKDLVTGKVANLNFPASDVLQFYLEDGSKISVRPSGTEPKIKFYISVNAPLASAKDFEAKDQQLAIRIKTIEKELISWHVMETTLTGNFVFLFERDLGKLESEIGQYQEEAALWKVEGAINNAAGNLCLHLCGNLQHYIGAQLGHSGYVRNRPHEFAARGISRADLLGEVQRTRQVVIATLKTLNDKSLSMIYPEEVLGYPMTTVFFLTHLLAHLSYHLGQINYHRRLTAA